MPQRVLITAGAAGIGREFAHQYKKAGWRVLATARAVGESFGLKIQQVLEKPLQIPQLEQLLERLRFASQSFSAERLMEAITNAVRAGTSSRDRR